MLTLLLIILITGLGLAVLLYAGALFLQGYIYTEPSRELYWQAPAAAGVLTLFLMLWCVLDANSPGAAAGDIPYDTLFRFSPRADLLKEPAKQIWAVSKDGEKTLYTRDRMGQTNYRYVDASYSPKRPWRGNDVESVVLDIDGESHEFKRVKNTGSSYPEFVDDKGWSMKDFGDGPDGTPSAFRWGRFLMNLILNFGFFLAWWLCLWLLMRFQWSHAFGLAFVLWIFFLFSVMPMLLGYAAGVAQGRAAG